MKHQTFFHCKTILCYFLVFFGCVTVQAQKLPNIQQNSLRTPVNIKIDGKATEWDGQFAAYNTATEVSYTISNDDNNLYLVLQAADPIVISNKIMKGGVTLVIQKSGKKTDKDAISISYPVIDNPGKTIFSLSNPKDVPASATVADKFYDSVMIHNNRILMEKVKYIQVTGIANVDTLISIYNETGIKAAGLFDNKKRYTCEMAIPLSLLGLNTTDAATFSYHILLNGGPSKYAPQQVTISGITDSYGNSASQSKIDNVNSLMANLNATYATTDFWGQYTLVKKP